MDEERMREISDAIFSRELNDVFTALARKVIKDKKLIKQVERLSSELHKKVEGKDIRVCLLAMYLNIIELSDDDNLLGLMEGEKEKDLSYIG